MIKDYEYLEDIPPIIVDIPTLQLIKVVDYKKFALEVSTMNMKREIEDNTGCYSLQVHISKDC